MLSLVRGTGWSKGKIGNFYQKLWGNCLFSLQPGTQVSGSNTWVSFIVKKHLYFFLKTKQLGGKKISQRCFFWGTLCKFASQLDTWKAPNRVVWNPFKRRTGGCLFCPWLRRELGLSHGWFETSKREPSLYSGGLEAQLVFGVVLCHPEYMLPREPCLVPALFSSFIIHRACISDSTIGNCILHAKLHISTCQKPACCPSKGQGLTAS